MTRRTPITDAALSAETLDLPQRRRWIGALPAAAATLSRYGPLTAGLLAGAAAMPAASAQGDAATGNGAGTKQKVLRYAFRVAESGFDPAQVFDLYSNIILSNIFEPPLAYDYLARPTRVVPLTAEALPEVSPDFQTYVVRIRPGIYFAADPAFKGQRRELTAADYVYGMKRYFDPKTKSPNFYLYDNAKILGMAALREQALKKGGFDYDREAEGLRALDRYTLLLRFGEPQPRFNLRLATAPTYAAVAREVVEFYGDKINEHPVGTGPFRLTRWQRSLRITLERNPDFREDFYAETPDAGDAGAVDFAAKLKGRKLPIVDQVEVSIIEENQPRWLAFVGNEHDAIEEVPVDFATIVLPNNELAPNLKKRGIERHPYTRADISISYFNMEDPLVGGYSPEKLALRRAICLAVDLDKEIRLVRRNQAIAAQSPVPPGVFGYDPLLRTESSEFSIARAQALLDLYGYVDRDGDGWRETPDGKKLEIEYTTQPDDEKRQLAEQWKKNMSAIGVQIKFQIAKFPENLKAARAAKLMMWGVGWSGTEPDGETFLALCYGPNRGQANLSRFDLAAFDRLFERQRVLPDGPERAALFLEAKKLIVAYAPFKMHVHRLWTDLTHPWVIGYRKNIFRRDFWKFVDIDVEQREREAG